MKFKTVADYFQRVEETRSKLEMTDILAELFKKVSPEDVDKVVYLCLGEILPAFKGIDMGVGEKFVENAIAKATGYTKEVVFNKYKDTGDLGTTAEELIKKKRQQSLFSKELTVSKVYDSFLNVAKASGPRSQAAKINGLVELLNNASPLEARYIARFPIGRIRLGIGSPTVMDALSVKHKGSKEIRKLLESRFNIHPDMGFIAKTLESKGVKGIKKIKIELGIPILPELCERLESAEDILKRQGGQSALEGKYDGMRLQVHKDGNKVTIFTRRLENVTHMFPDIVNAVHKQIKAKTAILDGEAMAFNEDSNEFYPFQKTMQRRRKHNIEKMSAKYPLKLMVFDLLYLNGKNMMEKSYKETRKAILKMIKKDTVILPSEQKIVDNAKDFMDYFEHAIERGLEGIIAKDINAPYISNARKFSWIKLKRDYMNVLGDTVDVVIVGGYKGHGFKAKFGLSSFLCAVYDKETDEFKTLTKVSTGFTEAQLTDMNKILQKYFVKKKSARVVSLLTPDQWIEPKVVIEIKGAELTRSTIHTTKQEFEDDAYAMRFPRLIGWIRDKRPEDATSVKEIVNMFKAQRQQRVQVHGDNI